MRVTSPGMRRPLGAASPSAEELSKGFDAIAPAAPPAARFAGEPHMTLDQPPEILPQALTPGLVVEALDRLH